jgi:hypothetical protein
LERDSQTRKIAVAAVAAALSSVCIILTNFIPLRITLLMFAAACYFFAFDKGGAAHGLLCIAASLLISFFTRPFSSAFFLTVTVFAPYSLAAYLMRKLYYTRPRQMAVRVAVMAAFSNLAFMGVYFLARFIDFDIMSVVDRFGYAAVTVALTAFCILFDIVFNQLTLRIGKAL